MNRVLSLLIKFSLKKPNENCFNYENFHTASKGSNQFLSKFRSFRLITKECRENFLSALANEKRGCTEEQMYEIGFR